MRRRRIHRNAEKAMIDAYIRQNGVSEIKWTPNNGQPWTLADNLDWIERTDPAYTPCVQRRPRQPDAR